MAEKKWKPFPMFIFTGEDGEDYIVANDRQIELLGQQVLAKEQELADAKDRKDKDTIKMLEYAVKAIRGAFDRTKKRADIMRPKCTKKEFEIAKPDFGYYIQAQEESKNYIDGEPRVDKSKLMLHMLAGHVMRDGDILEQGAVESLDPQIALVLWGEMESRLFPDPDRLPFL
jgi:hypothetical protein